MLHIFMLQIYFHIFGKTLRENDSNTFMVKMSRNVVVYPVSNRRLYVSVSDLIGVDRRGGYLRSTNSEGAITNNPFIGQQKSCACSLLYLSLVCRPGCHMSCVQSNREVGFVRI